VCFRWPLAHIQAHFRYDGLRNHHIDAIDAREVDPADPVQFTTQIELRRIPTSLLTRLGRLRLAAGFGSGGRGLRRRRSQRCNVARVSATGKETSIEREGRPSGSFFRPVPGGYMPVSAKGPPRRDAKGEEADGNYEAKHN
jgi:hypothetical protein